MNYLRIMKTIEYAQTGLDLVDGVSAWADILESMAQRLEASQVQYSLGNGPRGLEIGDVAGQNLADNFPVVDDWDPPSRTATSIKSTTQIQSLSQLQRLTEGWAAELDGIDEDLVGLGRDGQPIRIRPRAIRHRNLLIVIPEMPVGWSAPALASHLRTVSRVFKTSIRIVPVRGLRVR
jgi:hypothetical protein